LTYPNIQSAPPSETGTGDLPNTSSGRVTRFHQTGETGRAGT
jgi:hypothetical protein